MVLYAVMLVSRMYAIQTCVESDVADINDSDLFTNTIVSNRSNIP